MHSDDVADKILDAFGGVQEFATAYVDEYMKAPPGSPERSALLDGVIRLIEVANKKDQ
jgi:hypothetical protein